MPMTPILYFPISFASSADFRIEYSVVTFLHPIFILDIIRNESMLQKQGDVQIHVSALYSANYSLLRGVWHGSTPLPANPESVPPQQHKQDASNR